MLRAICTVLILNAMALGASAEENPQAILKKAAVAMRMAKSVSYTADYTATTWVKKFVPHVWGQVTLGQEKEYELIEFRCDVSIRAEDSEEDLQFKAGSDGDTFFLIDSQAKKMYQDMDQAVMGANARNIQRVVLRGFASSEPLKQLMESETVEYKGTHTVDGQLCHKVYVKTDEGQEQIWSFSGKDHLPRQVERMHKNREDEPGSTLLMLTNLKTNGKNVGNPFHPTTPAGFAKTDDFAP